MKRIFVVLVSFCFLPSLYAAEMFRIHRSVRALGMGDAYTAIVRDSDSLFYNPAGIGINSGVYWTIVDPYVGLNGTDSLEQLQNFQNSGDFAAAIQALQGSQIWIGGGGKTAIRLPYVAFAIYNHIDSSVALNDQTSNQLQLNYINDFGYALGFGANILPFTYIGISAHQITRTGTRTTYDPASVLFTSFDADLQNEGSATALNAGVTFMIDSIVSPAISFVGYNIGGTEFSLDSGTTAPPTDLEEWTVGASLAVDVGLISVTPALDVRYINDDEIDLQNKTHVGVEFGLPLIDIRAGFHQRYWTAGVGMGLGPLQVDAASWGVELGNEPGELEDRRYAIQLTLEMGLDLGMGRSSGGSGGKDGTRSRRKRRKQRR